jgi:hypothetical protein
LIVYCESLRASRDADADSHARKNSIHDLFSKYFSIISNCDISNGIQDDAHGMHPQPRSITENPRSAIVSAQCTNHRLFAERIASFRKSVCGSPAIEHGASASPRDDSEVRNWRRVLAPSDQKNITHEPELCASCPLPCAPVSIRRRRG